MAEGEEFVFDAVIGFLTSPIWNYPVRTFIEQNSLVFDSEGANHEEYQKIHSTYKSMVETLLSSFLKDVGISEEQFMTACKAGCQSPQFSSINRDVFDQIWAADDYEVFKRLMIQKNIELQLQALQIIQQIHNVQMPMVMPMPMPVPVAVQPTHPAAHAAPPAPAVDEDAIMREVLRRSKEEYESQMKSAEGKREKELQKKLAESEEENKRLMEIAKKEKEELEKALQISLEAQKQQTAEAEKLRTEVKQSTVQPTSKPPLVESKKEAKPTPPESKPAPKPSPVKSKSSTQDSKASEKSKATGLPALSGQPKKVANTASDAAAGWIQSAKDDAATGSAKQAAQSEKITPEDMKRRAEYLKQQREKLLALKNQEREKSLTEYTEQQPKARPCLETSSEKITPEDMKRRAEYLKQQRDKLLALKKQEREKSLTEYTEQQPKARPTTSRAARRVTAGEQVESLASKSSEEEAKKLAMRRALADVLKREVVDKE